ncbi:MAG: type II toxin-antitoxin system VapB family antitoxin [Planctomycetes bacterium]|nr:type II toxin-antitoxin system VapB family antitoxin [Planctomycetota bacterium]
MITTISIDSHLLQKAKRLAQESGKTLSELVEDALRLTVGRPSVPGRGYRFRIVTVRGTAPPSIDLADRDRLYDAMENHR